MTGAVEMFRASGTGGDAIDSKAARLSFSWMRVIRVALVPDL